jgi:alkanesulfonate monooxygenase SsuD/methylene tetrahydromethanopterin reductase-like flavin-dependent oxidoreductase (luciferase family)
MLGLVDSWHAGTIQADDWIMQANVDVNLHYGSADASNFVGVKGYESYASREATATAVLASAVAGNEAQESKPKTPGYHPSNLMIGTPEEVIKRIMAAQEACSFSEITIVPQFGHMPYDEAQKSTKLFAKEVLPVMHEMDAPLHALPEEGEWTS